MHSEILAALAMVALSATPTLVEARAADDTDQIFGRDSFAISSDLRDHGVDVRRVERWGDTIRAFVVNPDGTTSMKFFDRYTLAPISHD